jgi:hypothetical protein
LPRQLLSVWNAWKATTERVQTQRQHAVKLLRNSLRKYKLNVVWNEWRKQTQVLSHRHEQILKRAQQRQQFWTQRHVLLSWRKYIQEHKKEIMMKEERAMEYCYQVTLSDLVLFSVLFCSHPGFPFFCSWLVSVFFV